MKQQHTQILVDLNDNISERAKEGPFQCVLEKERAQLYGKLLSVSVDLEEYWKKENVLVDNLLDCDMDVGKGDLDAHKDKNDILDCNMPSVINMPRKISAIAALKKNTNNIALTWVQTTFGVPLTIQGEVAE